MPDTPARNPTRLGPRAWLGQLLLYAIDQAQRVGMTTAGDLLDLEKAQRWLGRRR